MYSVLTMNKLKKASLENLSMHFPMGKMRFELHERGNGINLQIFGMKNQGKNSNRSEYKFTMALLVKNCAVQLHIENYS